VFKLFFIFCILFNISAFAFEDDFDKFLNANKPNVKREEIIDPNIIQSGIPKKPKQQPKQTKEKPAEPFKKSVVTSNQEWTMLTANPKGQKMCYSVIYAKRRIGNLVLKEGEQLKAYLMVHYFSPYKQRVSIFFNYTLKTGTKVFLSVDGKQFEISPFESYAFAEDAETDFKIINAIKTGKRLLVRGEGNDNTYSVDEYEILGFEKIYNEMKTTCGNTN
jgi:hypothetical protein